MNYRYVAIEREYGSAGTEIGRRLTELGGIPSYGIEILEQVSERLNIDVAEIEQYEERATNSFLYSIYLMGKMRERMEGQLSNEGQIYLEEQRVIQKLAAQGPAVFVGRCAANALTDRTDVLKVFVRADKELRRKRAIESYGISPNEVEAVVHKFDRKRSNYYATNTGKNWHDLANYHLVLDSGKLGIDCCARLIWGVMNEESGRIDGE